MTPSGADRTRFIPKHAGCFTAALLGIAVLWPNLAAAADKGGSPTILPLVVPGDAVDRPTPEVAPGGTLVLRGTRPVNTNAGNGNAGNPPQANPGGGAPTVAGYVAPGWDQRFDYSGLDWGPPGPVIGLTGTGR